MPDDEFRKERRTNPYLKPKDPRVNECLWTRFQEHIFYEEYHVAKNKVVKQYSINVEFMKSRQNYFGEALDVCEEFGLLDFIEVNEDYDEHLVGQFYDPLLSH